jgi:D-glycero-D-manno-heptose 1,7-bisphosphate phosphatase
MAIAVFVDRDGTLNEEIGYITNVRDLRLIPGAAQAISRLNHAEVRVILTSNQSGPARGYYDERHVQNLNSRLERLLKEDADAWLDGVYYCPHLPDGVVEGYTKACQCRKPATGMIDQALKDFPDIELENSYVIGDKATDVEFAINAGCRGILLRTGYGEEVLKGNYQELRVQPYLICRDIIEAVDRILG